MNDPNTHIREETRKLQGDVKKQPSRTLAKTLLKKGLLQRALLSKEILAKHPFLETGSL